MSSIVRIGDGKTKLKRAKFWERAHRLITCLRYISWVNLNDLKTD